MSSAQPQPEIFKREQYFWCHEGDEHITKWLVTNEQNHPHIYATYLNDANAVMYRKRMEKSTEHDSHILNFLERYPMTHADVINELSWYKANILEQKDWSGVGPHMNGLVNVRTYDGSILILAQARDLLYKQVFDHNTRHHHWAQRGEQGLLNPNEVEPLSKEQKAHLKSQRRWAKRDAREAEDKARGQTDDTIDPALFAEGPYGVDSRKYVERLMLDFDVGKKETKQGEDKEKEE